MLTGGPDPQETTRTNLDRGAPRRRRTSLLGIPGRPLAGLQLFYASFA